MQQRTADYWIQQLQLTPHVEGGAFRELYRSSLKTTPPGFTGERHYSTSIYFLLQQGQFSAFHKIKSDELWHFYYGDALTIYEITAQGAMIEHQLGNDPEKGQSFQVLIPAGNWFAARLAEGGDYILCGCTVSPGFDFEDFELANKESLLTAYPQHKTLINALIW